MFPTAGPKRLNRYIQALEFWKHRQPSPDLPAGQVVGLLMAALQKNDHPAPNEGLRTVECVCVCVVGC